ncbi:MAG: hypothetical protein ACKVYV_12300 [Limisphaerales bacterium]
MDDIWQVVAALVIFVITAIVQGIQKARKSKHEAEAPPEAGPWREAWDGGELPGGSPQRQPQPPPAETRRLPAEGDWEAELRRMLGGEPPAPSEPPPLPPVVTRRAAEPVPEAWGETSPGHEIEPGYEALPAPETVLARMDESRAAGQRAAASEAQAQQRVGTAGNFSAADAAFARAAGIHDRVSRQMSAAASLQAQPVAGAGASPLAAPGSAARWRDLRTARDAVIASIVIGPPKALEP